MTASSLARRDVADQLRELRRLVALVDVVVYGVDAAAYNGNAAELDQIAGYAEQLDQATVRLADALADLGVIDPGETW